MGYCSNRAAYSKKVHLAFQAEGEATVQRFYQAGLAAGGQDNGVPGERHYHPGYYAAFLLAPDGNNVEAVHYTAMEHSAPSVIIAAPELMLVCFNDLGEVYLD